MREVRKPQYEANFVRLPCDLGRMFDKSMCLSSASLQMVVLSVRVKTRDGVVETSKQASVRMSDAGKAENVSAWIGCVDKVRHGAFISTPR